MVECFSSATLNRFITVVELAENNQSCVFCQVNNKIKEKRAKRIEGNMQESYYKYGLWNPNQPRNIMKT
jgi:hypothetical protein